MEAVRDLRGLSGGLRFVLKGDARRGTHPHSWPFVLALHGNYCAPSHIWALYLVPRQSSLDKFSAIGCPDGKAPIEENEDGQRHC
jgi:hypothetical protein